MPVEYWTEEQVDGFGSSCECGNFMLLQKSADVIAMRAKLRSGYINPRAEIVNLRYLNGQACE